MKPYRPLLAVAILVLAALACQALAPSQTQSNAIPRTDADVPRISVSEAKAALDAGSAILVDVRSVESYTASHAAGAMSIPLALIETSVNDLSLEKNQWIITYCT